MIIFSSCKDEISNKKFRNENYVFYQENGNTGEWRKIDPNLEIKLPKSYSTYFFPNGNRYAELEVIDSFPNRIIKYYDKEDDVLTRVSEYKNDTLFSEIYQNGYNRQYYSNLGHLKSEGLIKNNLSEGKWKLYRKDGGNIKQIVGYKNDTLNGIREDYWENGNLKCKSNNIKGKLNGETILYHENGKIQETKHLKDGKIHGILTQYFDNGQLEFKCRYWLDKKKDTCKFYYENGNLKKMAIIKLDTISGLSKKEITEYYETGELQLHFKSINHSMTGEVIKYHKNGKISSKYYLKNSLIDGILNSYYETGGIKLKSVFKNSTLEKYIEYYNEKGSLTKTLIVKNGKVVDSIIPIKNKAEQHL